MDAIPPALRPLLIASLSCFQLGEAGEGRVAHEAARSSDPALDDPMKECIALYVREEGKHARELAAALVALGAPIPSRHWSERLFRRGRRLLGLRTKMITISAAEVVGEAYYATLAAHVPPLAEVAHAIRRDEEKHLAFQAEYFRRVLANEGVVYALALGAAFTGITTCALATVLFDHAPLFRALGASRMGFAARCVQNAHGAMMAVRRDESGSSADGERSSARTRISAE
jgi:hypothetical protein